MTISSASAWAFPGLTTAARPKPPKAIISERRSMRPFANFSSAINAASAAKRDCDIFLFSSMLTFHHAFHQSLEEELLGEGKGEDAGGDDDDIDGGEIRPRPLPLPPLRGGKDDRHGAPRLVVDKRQAQKILAPSRNEIDDEYDDETIAHHRQAY